MCLFFASNNENRWIGFVIVAKVYGALSGMVGNVWGATVGLVVGVVIGGVGLLLDYVLFSMDISRSPSLTFLFPLA